MEKKGKTYCMGVECSVRNQCLRYTDGIGATMYDGTLDKYIRKCTNQKRFMQDSKNVKKGG
jgi:hypothetical protein